MRVLQSTSRKVAQKHLVKPDVA